MVHIWFINCCVYFQFAVFMNKLNPVIFNESLFHKPIKALSQEKDTLQAILPPRAPYSMRNSFSTQSDMIANHFKSFVKKVNEVINNPNSMKNTPILQLQNWHRISISVTVSHTIPIESCRNRHLKNVHLSKKVRLFKSSFVFLIWVKSRNVWEFGGQNCKFPFLRFLKFNYIFVFFLQRLKVSSPAHPIVCWLLKILYESEDMDKRKNCKFTNVSCNF